MVSVSSSNKIKIMDINLRKFTKFVDKTFIEGGKKAKEPVLLVSVAAVFKNPWHGQGFVEDLRPTILNLAPKLGDLLAVSYTHLTLPTILLV